MGEMSRLDVMVLIDESGVVLDGGFGFDGGCYLFDGVPATGAQTADVNALLVGGYAELGPVIGYEVPLWQVVLTDAGILLAESMLTAGV